MLFGKLHVTSKPGLISSNPITLKVSNWKRSSIVLYFLFGFCFTAYSFYTINRGIRKTGIYAHQDIDAQSIRVHSSSRLIILLKEFLLCFIMDVFLSCLASSTLEVFTQCFILVKENLWYILDLKWRRI